jgi:hypothetical protein
LVVVVDRMPAFMIAVTRLNSSQKAHLPRRRLLEMAYKQARKKNNHSGTWVRISGAHLGTWYLSSGPRRVSTDSIVHTESNKATVLVVDREAQTEEISLLFS